MTLSRRHILMTGGATVVIAGSAWALTRDPKTARAPWRAASEGFGDKRLDILAYAILAPNPHNMQPWQIRLDGDDGFTVYCDLNRLLPETDPPSRQITIGFGCFLELVRQAASEKGMHAEIVRFPDGEPFPNLDKRPIATVRLVEDASIERDPLFSNVLTRRTNRAPFKPETPDTNDLAAIAAAAAPEVDANATSDSALKAILREITLKAWDIEWNTPQTRQETIVVTRIGKAENNENPWGISLSGAAIDALKTAGVLTREQSDKPGTTAFKQSYDFYAKTCETAAAYAWIKTKTNTRADQLATGHAWVRMHLAANARGIAFHPLSQALQEFPEMAGPYQQIHEALGAENGETVQMLSRLGYASAPAPAPREALMSKIIEA